MAELCRQSGIARKTGYIWVDRYESEGLEGLRDRPYGAGRHPNQTPAKIEQRILQLRGAVTSNSVYDPGRNAIYSLSTGQPIWTASFPSSGVGCGRGRLRCIRIGQQSGGGIVLTPRVGGINPSGGLPIYVTETLIRNRI
jgi:leucine-zipper of insertion element IS481